MKELKIVEETTELVNKMTDAVNEEDYDLCVSLSAQLEPAMRRLVEGISAETDPDTKRELQDYIADLVTHLGECIAFAKEQQDEARTELIKLNRGSAGLKQYRRVRRNR